VRSRCCQSAPPPHPPLVIFSSSSSSFPPLTSLNPWNNQLRTVHFFVRLFVQECVTLFSCCPACRRCGTVCLAQETRRCR
jgi:hypothetical protein